MCDCWVRELTQLPGLRTLAMTTNGTFLAQHAAELHTSGLHRLNISLDSLRAGMFESITGHNKLANVLAGIDAAIAAGFDKIKLNVVVMRGYNDDEVDDFIEFVRERDLHVRFIEFMPFSGNGWEKERVIPWGELLGRIRLRHD